VGGWRGQRERAASRGGKCLYFFPRLVRTMRSLYRTVGGRRTRSIARYCVQVASTTTEEKCNRKHMRSRARPAAPRPPQPKRPHVDGRERSGQQRRTATAFGLYRAAQPLTPAPVTVPITSATVPAVAARAVPVDCLPPAVALFAPCGARPAAALMKWVGGQPPHTRVWRHLPRGCLPRSRRHHWRPPPHRASS